MCDCFVYEMVLHYKLFHCFFLCGVSGLLEGVALMCGMSLCVSTHVYVYSGIPVGLELMSLAFLTRTPLYLEVRSLG